MFLRAVMVIFSLDFVGTSEDAGGYRERIGVEEQLLCGSKRAYAGWGNGGQ